jgi:hypothetical protein
MRHGGDQVSETRRLLLEYETEEVAMMARKNKSVRKALVKSFSDTSEIVRERALQASIDLADPTIVPDVLKLLKDDDDNVRIAAAQALSWYQQPRTIPDLLQGLKDKNPWVRSHCAKGLSKLVHGPIWARLSKDAIETIVGNFDGMGESDIRTFMVKINVISEDIDRFLVWRKKEFDIDLDATAILHEIEGKPIILEGTEVAPVEAIAAPTTKGISGDVEEILSELPDEIRATLPPEDLRRLTPTTARELVDSLKDSFPEEKPEKEKKKKKVKVRKVKRVRRKRKGPTREELLEKIPEEVKESLSQEVLDGLSLEELEALIATPAAAEVEEPKPKKKRQTKREKLIAKLPADVRDSMTEEVLYNLTTKELEELVASTVEEEPEKEEPEVVTPPKDPRFDEFASKYGEEKAELLVTIPTEMLDGIPEDQIEDMDLETLKGLTQALGPP